MNRAIAISNEHMIVTNGTDPDLEQYFAFGSEKLKIADNFDEIKMCIRDSCFWSTKNTSIVGMEQKRTPIISTP